MLWKINGKTMKTPSSYKDNIEDLDNDSYTSKQEAEELLQATYQNPMMVTIKCPSVKGRYDYCPF